MSDPFVVLGIERTADRDVIRAAWRALAKTSHPDVGGSHEQMKILNAAFRDAMSLADTKSEERSSNSRFSQSHETSSTKSVFVRSMHVRHDISSFTIDVLPVESFELLRVAASTLGQLIDEDCPYMIEFTLESSRHEDVGSGWCRCDVVPEAGGSMVHLTIGGTSTPVENVRDEIIFCINDVQS